ncbi:hydrogenase-4 component E [Rhodoblastus acidophilus]|uniref:hydrogenase 4 membrane subunit n=1 Tax=Rhodoblastus acidophilus TaxID=1074 RepID=UPI002224659F|nr:hydrogenase 4 membrane subunit [Rhodoblastus acidophilus]MCW2285409.1 hydrogenase-4 component E [Rhodoblastus acidophilus]MCW2334342.1 hydrogenase-4 component E [Rhodoblastus acidophilus]
MLSFALVNTLAGFLIVTSQSVILAKTSKSAAKFYSLQSLLLVLIFLVLARLQGAHELYLWSATAFVTKVVLLPLVMLKFFGKLVDPNLEAESILPPAASVALSAAVVILCFVVVLGVSLPGSADIKPALAISLAHFFLGLVCIVTQRNILKQVFGYCLMENGSHLTLALLAPNAPELVEVGIATDAIFAVVVMGVLGTQIFRQLNTLDARALTTLKG